MVTMMRRYVFATGLPECRLQIDAIIESVSEHVAKDFAGEHLEEVYNFIDYGSLNVGNWMMSIDRYGRHVLIARTE